MLPIGDNFTMGPEDAVKAVGFLQPKTAILMHYNTFGVIAEDAQAVAAEIKAKTKAEPVILKPGGVADPTDEGTEVKGYSSFVWQGNR